MDLQKALNDYAPDKEDSVFFSSVVHELYHACQRHTMGLVRYLLSKLFSRSVLEHLAKDAELDAVLWFCDLTFSENEITMLASEFTPIA